MMIRRTFVAAAAALLIVLAPQARLFAAESAQPTAAEQSFVESVSADIAERFPTPDAARKAGYVRYTDEDDTGAISYANRQWTSVDEKHPSQVWYDVRGRLLGVDISVPYTDTPPTLFGILPARWEKIPAHVHYGLVGADGTTYGATGRKKIESAGGSFEHPSASTLVKLGIAKKTSDVRFVFLFPAVWDLTMWVIPNPDGAFAEKNPNVKPVSAKSMSM